MSSIIKMLHKPVLIIPAIILGLLLIAFIVYAASGANSADPRTGVRSDLKYPAVEQADIDMAKSLVDPDLTYDIVASNPVEYKNMVVQWPAKVFVSPDNDGETVYLQVYAEDGDKPYVVSYTNPDFEINVDDYLLVTGVVAGSLDGENAFGAGVNRVAIKANYVEQSDRVSLFEPEIESKIIDQTNSQHNFSVTVDRIVRSKNETRLYLSVNNATNSEVSLYVSQAKIVQKGQQYEEKYTYEDTMLPSSYKPRVVASGHITFPALKDLNDIEIYIDEPYSYDRNYDITWNEIVFDVK